MYKFIKIRHDILIQCHGNYMEMKIFNLYAWDWHLKKFLTKKNWVSWGVLSKGLGVQKDTQTPCWLRLCFQHCLKSINLYLMILCHHNCLKTSVLAGEEGLLIQGLFVTGDLWWILYTCLKKKNCWAVLDLTLPQVPSKFLLLHFVTGWI